jgi:hypothetical protein
MREIAIPAACVGGERSLSRLQPKLQRRASTRIDADQNKQPRKSALIRGKKDLGWRVFPPPASNRQLTSGGFAPNVEVAL